MQLGRFWGVDKLSEVTYGLTPFHYSMNNPVSGNDPTGLITFSLQDQKEKMFTTVGQRMAAQNEVPPTTWVDENGKVTEDDGVDNGVIIQVDADGNETKITDGYFGERTLQDGSVVPEYVKLGEGGLEPLLNLIRLLLDDAGFPEGSIKGEDHGGGVIGSDIRVGKEEGHELFVKIFKPKDRKIVPYREDRTSELFIKHASSGGLEFVSPVVGNYYSLLNILVHEGRHMQQAASLIFPIKNVAGFIRQQAALEINAIQLQMKHSSFSLTPQWYKSMTNSYLKIQQKK
jgi:hypothetical protein